MQHRIFHRQSLIRTTHSRNNTEELDRKVQHERIQYVCRSIELLSYLFCAILLLFVVVDETSEFLIVWRTDEIGKGVHKQMNKQANKALAKI